MFQVGSLNGFGSSATVDYTMFEAGAQTQFNADETKCTGGCSGFSYANANWLQEQFVGNNITGGLDRYIEFLANRDAPIEGGFFMKILAGPLAFWTDHWAGPGGFGTPGGKGDWAATVHDYNWKFNGPTEGQTINIGMASIRDCLRPYRRLSSRATAHSTATQAEYKELRCASSSVGEHLPEDHTLSGAMRKTVRSPAMIGIVMMSLVVSAAVAQSAPRAQEPTPETQTRGVWTDTSTKLMWAAKDNGKDVSYKGAVNYCRDLRLAGHSDWRLATLAELQGIYDKTANAPGLAGPHNKDPFQWHVKGNLFLTGHQWAQNPDGYTGSAYVFNFNEGRLDVYSSGFWYSSSFRRALCVRGPEK